MPERKDPTSLFRKLSLVFITVVSAGLVIGGIYFAIGPADSLPWVVAGIAIALVGLHVLKLEQPSLNILPFFSMLLHSLRKSYTGLRQAVRRYRERKKEGTIAPT